MKTTYYLLVVLGVTIAVLMFFMSTPALGVELKSTDRGGHLIYPPPHERMNVSMEVLVDGRPMRTIHYGGKIYLPVSQLGTEYQIRVHNHGPRRIVAMVSVDGLSVLNGKSASEFHPGYVVNAHSHIVIRGWRRDMETVAAFSFEEREWSYAARVGRPENIGVIGLIAIEEASRILPLEELKGAAPSTMRRDASELGGIGTGYGRDIESGIYYVPFVRSANRRTITFHYDTVAALRRAGVPVDGWSPLPFPADTEFVPPPPPWPGYRFN
jgi:hypothetical protein